MLPVTDQLQVQTDELNRRREECIQLRTLLATRSRGGIGIPAGIADESYGGDNSLVNEDGELEMAYKTQKDLNKLVACYRHHSNVTVTIIFV